MNTYICKCGRVVTKSTTADNTGNRDTAGCEGCPYLLPWGPDRYVQGKGFVKDIQGYECRVSPTLEYRTELHGRLDDKTTIRVTSLDFDFLERVSDWVKEHYPNGELSGRFSRDRIRAVEYVDQGRYRYTLACSQNKKGIAAKRALWAEFFDEGFHRKDMDADAEKQKILRDIEQGKATHKDAAATDKERNTVLIYRDPATGWLYRVSPQPENGSYVMQCCDPANSAAWKWCADWNVGNIYRESLEEVLEARAKREGWEPVSDLASGEAMKTADDSHGIMTEAGELLPNGSECRRYAVSRARAREGQIQAIHVCDDQPENVKIWLNASCPAEYWVLSKEGEIEGEHIESCPYCAVLLRIGCGDVLLVPYGAELESNKPPKIPEQNNEPACSCAGCKREDCTCAGGRDAAGRTDCTGEQNCAQSGCTYAAKHRANLTQAAPACPADAASLAAETPIFDYSSLDAGTAERLQNLARRAMSSKKRYFLELMEIVAEAHQELVQRLDKRSNQYSDGTFTSWCASIGVSRSTAYSLLQVQTLMDNSTPEEQLVLAEAPQKVLRAISKPSTPVEVVQAAKNRDITTYKQYQEAMAQLKAEREARERAEQQLADAQREHQAERASTSALLLDEQQRRQKAEESRIAAQQQVRDAQSKAARYAKMKDAALETLKIEREKARSAQSGQAQQLADAKKQWQAEADREKQDAVAAAIEQARTDARASASVDVLFDQLENTVAALQAALETLEDTDADKAAKLRRSLARLLQTLAAQMEVG